MTPDETNMPLTCGEEGPASAGLSESPMWKLCLGGSVVKF